MGRFSEIIITLEDFNEYVRKCAEGSKNVHGGMVLGKEMRKEEDRWSSAMKKSSAWQTHPVIRNRKEKSLVVRVDVKQKSILCLCGKHRMYIKDVKVFP